jgi:peptidoglycan/xylan/chitin deacetylase (PgdA/CDA1 family)
MRERIMVSISACLYYSGLINILRWWILRRRRSLLILNYHRGSGGHIERQLLYLRRHFRILHLQDALEELYKMRNEQLRKKDSRPLLVLTFDDGYADNYTCMFQLVRKLQIPITIFLIPGYMENDYAFWWMDRFVRHAQVDRVTLEKQTYWLKQQKDRKLLAQTIDREIRQATSRAEREKFLTTTRNALAIPSSLLLQGEPTLLLNWEQVQEMNASGWVSFGAHTVHHPVLGDLPDPGEVQHEVTQSRLILEQHLQHQVCIFAYPYGKKQHIGRYGVQATKQAGYEWAVTTLPGFNTPLSNPYLLHRIFADADQHQLLIATRTSGAWQIFMTLYYKLKKCFKICNT